MRQLLLAFTIAIAVGSAVAQSYTPKTQKRIWLHDTSVDEGLFDPREIIVPDGTLGIDSDNGVVTFTPSSLNPDVTFAAATTVTLDSAQSVYFHNGASASVTVTLPTAASVNGQAFVIGLFHNGTAQTATIDPAASETVCGRATYALSVANASIMIFSDGSQYLCGPNSGISATAP